MNEIITINPQEYGLEQAQADKIIEAFREPLAKMAELETEFKNFENITGDPPESTCAEAKELKQKYVKIRTATAAIHKTEKAFFWNAGKCIDAFKNRQLEIGKEREDRLAEIADYYENIKKAEIAKLTEEREKALLSYQVEERMYIPPALGEMPKEAWETYFDGVKRKYEDFQAEQKRIKLEKEAEEKRQREEQERIRKENEQLQKEAAKKEKELAKERAEKERLEAEHREKLEAEKKASEEREAKIRAEKERLEKEKLEKEEAERKAIQEKEEAEKKAAAAPDKEKLNTYLTAINKIEIPEMQTDTGKMIAQAINEKMNSFCSFVYNEILNM